MTDEPSDLEDRYGEHYLAYIDLLGFKSEVQMADCDASLRPRLREILRLVRETLCEDPRVGMKLTHFSDCLVVSVNRTLEGLWEILRSIDILTFNLLQYDVLVRGGLVAGGAHHETGLVYGVAVNRAYLLESTDAVHPRTVVAAEVMADIEAAGAEFTAWVQRDTDGLGFVHYLRCYEEYRDTPIYEGKVIMTRPANRVIDFVQHRLNVHEGRIRSKAEWLRAYWNRTVAVNGIFERIEAGVTERYDSGGPTIMMRRIAGG